MAMMYPVPTLHLLGLRMSPSQVNRRARVPHPTHQAGLPARAALQLRELNMQTNKLEGEGWAHLLPLRSLSRLDLRHQLGNRRLALPAGLLSLPSLQVGATISLGCLQVGIA